MVSREAVDLVVAGGASHVATLDGAARLLASRVDVMRVAGASAGAIVAAAEAFAIAPKKRMQLLDECLQNNALLDLSLWPLHRYGLFKGDRLRAALAKVFGGLTLSDALIPLRIVVCDLWTRRPVMLDSTMPEHATILVVDALHCSAAIPGFFRAGTLSAFGNRLFVDGGCAVNFPMRAYRDQPRRTIGVRMAPDPEDVRPVNGLKSYVASLASLLTWAQTEAHVSDRDWGNVVTCPAIGSGLDFALSADVIRQRQETGREAVSAWLDTQPRRGTVCRV